VNITGGPSMSLVEIDEATEIIHEAAGEEANVILGAVVDENMTDEIMVTVIATGFNRRAGLGAVRLPKSVRVVDRIPTGAAELQKLDEPAFVRRGVDLTIPQFRGEPETNRPKIDKTDPEKPAFLRKIMD
jgi:cell division protein FtsZ